MGADASDTSKPLTCPRCGILNAPSAIRSAIAGTTLRAGQPPCALLLGRCDKLAR